MRRAVILSLFAALASIGSTGPAEADTPGCVSRHEYDRVTTGMTMTRVHKIFDTEGQSSRLGAPNQLRMYKTCTGRGRVQVIYTQGGRVVSKDGRFF